MGHTSPRPFAILIATAAVLLMNLGFVSDAEAGVTRCRWWQIRCTPENPPAPVPRNRAPVIGGSPALTAVPGQLYQFTPVASDPDRNVMQFRIANRPQWASFSGSTGRLSGTPTTSQAGVYVDIRISVSDGLLTAALPPFSITVGQAPTPNRAPTISGSPAVNAREGQAYAFTPVASDADGNRLSFTIVNRPSWAAFSSTTGALTGTPGVGTVGNYPNISIRVSDGTASAALPTFAIDVQQVALGSATLSWSAPSTRTDGSPLSNLAGYRIRYGTSSGSYPNTIQLANPGLTTTVVPNLPPATWYFVLSAYDSAGFESAQTAPVTKTIR